MAELKNIIKNSIQHKLKISKKLIMLIIFIALSYNNFTTAYAQVSLNTQNKDIENTSIDKYDYSDINKAIEDTGYSINFQDILKIIYEDYSVQSGKSSVKDKFIRIFDEVIGATIKSNKMTIVQIILLAVTSALVSCFTPSFNKDHVSDIAQMVISIALISILLACFTNSYKISEKAILSCVSIYKAVVPIFFSAVVAITGSVTATVYYEIVIMLISFVTIFFKNILLSFNKIYIMFSMADSVTQREYFTKMAEFVPAVIKISCRASIIFFTGLGGIKGITAQTTDSMKKKVLYKAIQSIPVVGDSLDAVGQTVVSAGSVLKNGIGVASIIVILVMCSIPIIKLVVTMCILKAVSAMIEPVADKRIVKAVNSVADTTGFMSIIVLTSAGLFILMVSVICIVSNGS